MAFSSSKSQFGKSTASNFGSSRMNQPFNTSRLPPPQLPFQVSGHLMGSSSMSMRQNAPPYFIGMGFGNSRIPVDPTPATSFQRDEEYKPDPTVYGNLSRTIDSYKCDKLERMIADRITNFNDS